MSAITPAMNVPWPASWSRLPSSVWVSSGSSGGTASTRSTSHFCTSVRNPVSSTAIVTPAPSSPLGSARPYSVGSMIVAGPPM